MFKRYELHNHTTESDALISCEELLGRMVEEGVDCGEEGHTKKLMLPLPHYFLLLFPLQSCRYLPTWC